MKLVAAVTIGNHKMVQMKEDEIKDFVMNSLAHEISTEVAKHLEIEETKDVYNDTTRYSGTITSTPLPGHLTIRPSSIVNGSIYTTNGNGSSSYKDYSQINLRVVEYTKNGKVTRVELQKYDEHGDEWFKIPRIQIEE
jgi:hypothetical protein